MNQSPPGILHMAIKFWMVSGYSTAVESDSFGCLPPGGHTSQVGHWVNCGNGGTMTGARGIEHGVVSFLHCYIMSYQRL